MIDAWTTAHLAWGLVLGFIGLHAGLKFPARVSLVLLASLAWELLEGTDGPLGAFGWGDTTRANSAVDVFTALVGALVAEPLGVLARRVNARLNRAS